MQIRNQYDLIREHNRLHPESHMFDSDTLRFFGERKSEMKLCGTVKVLVHWGKEDGIYECYKLKTYQRNAPEGVSKTHYHYFDVNTLERVLAAEEGG